MLQVSCLQAFQSPTTTVSGMACTMSLNSVIGPLVPQGQYTETTLVNLLLWTMSTNAAFFAAPLAFNADGGCFLHQNSHTSIFHLRMTMPGLEAEIVIVPTFPQRLST